MPCVPEKERWGLRPAQARTCELFAAQTENLSHKNAARPPRGCIQKNQKRLRFLRGGAASNSGGSGE